MKMVKCESTKYPKRFYTFLLAASPFKITLTIRCSMFIDFFVFSVKIFAMYDKCMCVCCLLWIVAFEFKFYCFVIIFKYLEKRSPAIRQQCRNATMQKTIFSAFDLSYTNKNTLTIDPKKIFFFCYAHN